MVQKIISKVIFMGDAGDGHFDELGHRRRMGEMMGGLRRTLSGLKVTYIPRGNIGQFRTKAVMKFAEELIGTNIPRMLRPAADNVAARIGGLSDLSESKRRERIICATELMQMNLREPNHEDIGYILVALYEYLKEWSGSRRGAMNAEEDRVLLPVLGAILMRGMGPVELERKLSGGGHEWTDASGSDCIYELDRFEGRPREEVVGMLPKVLGEIERGRTPEVVGMSYEILGSLLGFEEMPRIIAGLKNPSDIVKRYCANTIMNVFADNGRYLVASRHVPPAVVALHNCMRETRNDKVFITAAAAIFVSRMGPLEARARIKQDLAGGRGYEGPRPQFGPGKAERTPAGVTRLAIKQKR